MPMFKTEEEFEAYVAQQQAELAGPVGQSPAQPKPTAFEEWQRVLTLVVPLAMVALAGYFFWVNGPGAKPQHKDPWDKIFGTMAWLGGREYNADADNLTDRMTFDKPLERDTD